MAYYSIFPNQDTTLYSQPDRKSLNTGHDEIIELVKERGSSDNILYPTRMLMKFSQDDIDHVIKTFICSDDKFGNQIGWIIGINKANGGCDPFQSTIDLTSANAENLLDIINIEAYPMSQSWSEGTGRFTDVPTGSNGCSWIYRDNDVNQQAWQTASIHYTNSPSTGSIDSTLITHGGGTSYTGSSDVYDPNNTYNSYVEGFRGSQQLLAGDSLDVSMDVTTTIMKFYGGGPEGYVGAFDAHPFTLPNNGFVIKQPDHIEENVSSSFGDLQYFSSNTHTIHPPKLTFKWDDSIHESQSLAKLSGSLDVTLYKNQEEFNQNDEVKFRIHIRDKYPNRTFTTTSNYLNTGYFTTSSFYSIRDAHTEREIIPFDDDYTKMSADSEGMYFNIYMKGLQPE